VLFTASGDFFDQNPKLTKHFFRLCVAFAAKRFGIDNIIAATVHMDEETPHLHLDFVPLTADGRLSAKSVLGGRKEMQQLQDDFYEQVSRRFGLERGSRADLDAADPDEQPRKHLTTRELKAATAAQLAEQEQLIDLNQTELQALEQQIDLNQTELQALEQALDGVQEQLREVRRQLNQLDAEKRKAVLTANDAEQHAILAEGRAEQADKRAETAEIRLHSAETRLSEINAQYDAAAKELGDVLGKKARAAEIHKLGDLFGETVHYHKNMLESTRAIGYEAHQKLQKALSALEEAKALEVRAKALQAQIEPLQRQAQADRDAAAQLRQEQEQLIQSRAAELTDKRIKSMFGATPDSRRERLERFCEKVKLPDGKTVLDVFEEQERRLRAKGKNFHGIS
jgi:phage shock protein A